MFSTLSVSSGVFTANLSYPNQFPGDDRWLEISVRPSGGGAYTVLTPRQQVLPAPYAIGLQFPMVGAANILSGIPAVSISNTGGAGLRGTSTNSTLTDAAGVVGVSTALGGNGVAGFADVGDAAYGVYGQADSGLGVRGASSTGIGVQGSSNTGPGVRGNNHDSIAVTSAGVVGESFISNGNGVSGLANSGSNAYGVYGQAVGGGYAGFFFGRVNVTGVLSKGGGAFRIDHPLDPANKYLSHSFVESPDMMNIYNGEVTTDPAGYATITMPEWFQTLNFDFRYQLTVIDDGNSADFVQAKIVSRIRDNQFSIRTSAPSTAVSWQVTGIRHDPFANANRIQVEELKSDLERGFFLHPEVYGRSADENMVAAKVRAAAANPTPASAQRALPPDKADPAPPTSAAESQ